MPDLVRRNAAISEGEKGVQWREALRPLEEPPQRSLMPDVASCNTTNSACEKGEQ